MERTQKPFEYKHLRYFAYVGDNKAVLELPILGQLMCVGVWCGCMDDVLPCSAGRNAYCLLCALMFVHVIYILM